MDYRDTVPLPETGFPPRAALSEREPAQVEAGWEDSRPPGRRNAGEQMELQRRDLKGLGICARWDRQYLTMVFRYEADIVRELASFTRRGALYRRKRPVHWCPVDVTALAEAEVEYADRTSPSIYVRFPVTAGGPQGWGLAIWTTTPWTIPANLAITANPELEYVAYDLPRHGVTVVARDLLHAFLAACAPDELSLPAEARGDDLLSAARATGATLRHPERIRRTLQGTELDGWKYRHPLVARESPVIMGAHATADAGTGLVHTAPGHGEDDFNMGVQYGLPIWAPVDGHGRFTGDVGIAGLEGLKVFDANPKVIELLAGAGVLLNAGGRAAQIRHSYPHCWRCKNPVIFRATDQWWIGLDIEIDLPGRGHTTIRKAALAAIDEIDAQGGWIPAWARSASGAWWKDARTGASRDSGRGASRSPSSTALGIASPSSRPRRWTTSRASSTRKARTHGSTGLRASFSPPRRAARSAAAPNSRRSPTSSTSGSTRGRPSPPCSRAASGRRCASPRISTWKARISTAAGSCPR